METTRFAAVFNIDPEDHVPGVGCPAVACVRLRLEGANASQNDGIGRCRTWLWPADLMIIRVAEVVGNSRTNELSARAAAQASAQQRVIYAFGSIRMEIHIDFILRIAGALIVADVRPLAADARITQNLTAVLLAEGRAQLTTMRDVVQYQVRRLQGIEGIAVVRLTQADIVRHRLVTKIVTAYGNGTQQAATSAKWTGRKQR